MEEIRMVDANNWRLMNQELYLKDREVFHINYNQKENHDHDHCAFCAEKFMSEKEIGYCTQDYYYWICENCFEDFKDMFNWKVINK